MGTSKVGNLLYADRNSVFFYICKISQNFLNAFAAEISQNFKCRYFSNNDGAMGLKVIRIYPKLSAV